jgi:hypothetical protein
MFRLVAIILIALMGDWVFLGGRLAVRPLIQWVEAGADYVADLIFRFVG